MKEMKKVKRVVPIILAVALALTACSNRGEDGTESAGKISTPVGEYPVESAETLTYWTQFTAQAASGVTNFSQLPFFEEYEKRTGIKVKYIHPVSGQETEQFNLLLASGEYPDIIERDFYSFKGGPNKALQDEYIIELNDAIDKWAPNLKKYLKDHPEVDKDVKTDDGKYYCFPFIRSDKYLLVFQGPMVRADYLRKAGLEAPETLDEWETMLRKFKEMGIKTPLAITSYFFGRSSAIMGTYGVKKGVYVRDGKVKYGPNEEGFRQFITKMNQWYQEGLLDQNVASADNKTVANELVAGNVGVCFGNTLSGLGTYTVRGKSQNPDFELIPLKYPVLKKGDICDFGQTDSAYGTFGSPVISTQCKNVELATRLLDYGYSEEGALMCNFGIEGESYEMVNGEPKYTDLIMKNPDGKSPSEAKGLYTRPNGNGPYIQDSRYMEQMAESQAQKDSINIWSDTNADKYTLPKITLTVEESERASTIANNLSTYVDEMMYKFILGVEPMKNYDAFLAQLKNLEVDEYLELEQAAYDRYMTR